jgi:hypothetical protein
MPHKYYNYMRYLTSVVLFNPCLLVSLRHPAAGASDPGGQGVHGGVTRPVHGLPQPAHPGGRGQGGAGARTSALYGTSGEELRPRAGRRHQRQYPQSPGHETNPARL